MVGIRHKECLENAQGNANDEEGNNEEEHQGKTGESTSGVDRESGDDHVIGTSNKECLENAQGDATDEEGSN